jgi:glycosyltransferase involved in cell wall biosynthesis
MRMPFAPIALFVYNRALHLERTVRSLQNNAESRESELFIFSDGPRVKSDISRVESVRRFARSVSGFKRVSIIARERNLGLSQSIITGITEIVAEYGHIIVLEDDMVTSPYFLRYMNEALNFYRNDERVISIHSYVYPLQVTLPETFFLRGADCWGWATWKRGWDLFEPDGNKLVRNMRSRGLTREFDLNGAYPYTSMLEKQSKGKVDSWAIRWHASAFLANRLTLYPGTSLVSNIGLDASGTHCTPTDQYDVVPSSRPVDVRPVPVEEREDVRSALQHYHYVSRPSLVQLSMRRISLRIARRKGAACHTR